MKDNVEKKKEKEIIYKADACRDVGIMLVAKHFVNKGYELSSKVYVGSSFFNKIFIKMDMESDPDACYPPTPFYDECYNLSYSKEQLCQAVTMLFGGMVAENIVFGSCYDNCSGNHVLAKHILRSAVANGAFGIEAVVDMYFPYGEDSNFSHESYNSTTARLIDLYKSVAIECYNQACDILKDKKLLIEQLMQAYIERTFLKKSQIDEIIAQFEGNDCK